MFYLVGIIAFNHIIMPFFIGIYFQYLVGISAVVVGYKSVSKYEVSLRQILTFTIFVAIISFLRDSVVGVRILPSVRSITGLVIHGMIGVVTIYLSYIIFRYLSNRSQLS